MNNKQRVAVETMARHVEGASVKLSRAGSAARIMMRSKDVAGLPGIGMQFREAQETMDALMTRLEPFVDMVLADEEVPVGS